MVQTTESHKVIIQICLQQNNNKKHSQLLDLSAVRLSLLSDKQDNVILELTELIIL